jgi:hypothetical protein
VLFLFRAAKLKEALDEVERLKTALEGESCVVFGFEQSKAKQSKAEQAIDNEQNKALTSFLNHHSQMCASRTPRWSRSAMHSRRVRAWILALYFLLENFWIFPVSA